VSQYRTLLGFDYGSKRIGVAVGQELTRSAQGLRTLHNNQSGPDWPAISELIQEWQPELLVVGMPHNMDDTPHPLAPLIEDFGKQLQQRYNLPVVWHWRPRHSWQTAIDPVVTNATRQISINWQPP